MATGDGLARVTYLPGAIPAPPVAPEQPHFSIPEPGDSEFGDLGPGSSRSRDHQARNPESQNLESQNPQAQNPQSRDPSSGNPEREGFDRDELGRDATERRAENVSLGALTRRGMSRWELEKTLLSRDLEENVVAEELERLERVGLIDDLALAETLVRTQHQRKGLGRSALIAELRRRHIPQEAIDAALKQVDDVDEQVMATELAVKRAGQLSTYDVDTAKRRLTAFLMRKGYSSSIIRTAVDAALGDRARTVRFR